MSSKQLSQIALVVGVVALALGAWAVFRSAESIPIVATTQGVTNFSTLQVDDGTTTVTAYGFTNDPDTGLNLSATGILDFIIAGASVLTVDSTGLVPAAGSVFDCNGVADCFVIDADGDTTMSAPTDDQIDFELAGIDAYVMNVTGVVLSTTAVLDLQGSPDALVLDADNDTTISAPNDDQIDFEAGGTTALSYFDTGATGSGGDIWDYTDTLNIADGSDDWKFLDLNVTGADATGTANTIQALDLALITPDAQVIETAIVVNANWDKAADFGEVPVYSVAAEYYDPFLGDTIRAEGIYSSGADATDPALNQQQYGAVRLVAGATDSGFADDFSGATLGLHWSADQGGVVFAASVAFITDIDDFEFCIGLNDTLTDEMFAQIGADGTPDTINSGDGVAFCVDDTMTTNNWAFVGSNGGAEATGTAQSSVLPVAGAFDDLRVEVSADGAEAQFFINGSLVGTTTGGSVTAASLLTPFIVIDDDGGNSQTVDVRYWYVSAKLD